MGVSCRSAGRAFQGCGFRLRPNAGVCFRAFFQNALTLSIPHTVSSQASIGAASSPSHAPAKKIICLQVVSAGCRVLLCKTRVYFFSRKEICSQASIGAASSPLHAPAKKIICLQVVSAGCRVLLCKTRIYFFPREEMCSQASISHTRRHIGFWPPEATNTYTINPCKRPQSQGFC